MAAPGAVIHVCFNEDQPAKIIKWKVKPGSKLSRGSLLFLYDYKNGSSSSENGTVVKSKFKSSDVGTLISILKEDGMTVIPGEPLCTMQGCTHPIVMKEMCAECGADLKVDSGPSAFAACVSMVHSIPELMVSQEQAHLLGKADEYRLLKNRKLVLLVDLDQTLVHTTNDNIPPNIKDVYHFQLYGSRTPWYHTRLRPGTRSFLENISTFYELQICTFGARSYAHMIAHLLDEDGRLFSHRILSRDECFNPTSKTGNLKALFPCGDSMVCIIDDREDVWNYAPNLVHVKPYHFFQHTGDINAPPGLTKTENDEDEPKSFINKIVSSKNNDLNKNEALPSQTSGRASPLETDKIEVLPTQTSGCASPLETDKIEVLPSQTSGCDSPMETDKVDGKIELPDRSEDTEAENPTDKDSTAKNDTNVDTKEPSDVETKATRNEESLEPESKLNDHKTTSEDGATQISESSKDGTCNEETLNENGCSTAECNKDRKPSGVVDLVDTENSNESSINSAVLYNSKEVDVDSTAVTSDVSKMVGETKKVRTIGDVDMQDESEIVVEDDDDYLLHLEDKLRIIHRAYFEMYDQMREEGKQEIPDTKYVVPYVKRKVLKGTNIVFSGVIPTNMPPEKSKAWIVAKSLGAAIQNNIIPRGKNSGSHATTHVIGARLGTAKVNEARRLKGVHIVNPDWLWCCSERWERVEEGLFPLTKNTIVEYSNPIMKYFQDTCLAKDGGFSDSEVTSPLIVPEAFPCYDPVTGKRIVKHQTVSLPSNSQRASSSSGVGGQRTNGEPGTFVNSLNPLLLFSTKDIAAMDQEVEDMFNESDESDSEKTLNNSAKKRKKSSGSESESSNESLSGDHPRGWGTTDLKRRKTNVVDTEEDTNDLDSEKEPEYARFPRGILPHDSEKSDVEGSASDYADSIGSVDEEMAAAVEREFLSN